MSIAQSKKNTYLQLSDTTSNSWNSAFLMRNFNNKRQSEHIFQKSGQFF